MSLQLWHRTPKKSRSWSKFTNLKKDATLEMVTYEGDEWVALDKRTQKTLEINGDTKYYQPKLNTQESRAICIITRKGNGIFRVLFSLASYAYIITQCVVTRQIPCLLIPSAERGKKSFRNSFRLLFKVKPTEAKLRSM